MVGTEFIENNPETKPFWEAAAAGRFVLPWCQQCRKTHWFPRGFCPHCLSTELDWREASGEGEIYTFSVNRTAKQPFVAAYVALKEGPIMLTNVVDSDPATLAIGRKVRVVFKPDDGQLPVPLVSIS